MTPTMPTYAGKNLDSPTIAATDVRQPGARPGVTINHPTELAGARKKDSTGPKHPDTHAVTPPSAHNSLSDHLVSLRLTEVRG